MDFTSQRADSTQSSIKYLCRVQLEKQSYLFRNIHCVASITVQLDVIRLYLSIECEAHLEREKHKYIILGHNLKFSIFMSKISYKQFHAQRNILPDKGLS